MKPARQEGTPILPPNRNGGSMPVPSSDRPEIIIKVRQGELTKKEDVVNYCKKISEELAATSKLRLEVDMTI